MSAFRSLGDYISRRRALRFARKKGAESGRLEQEPEKLGQDGEVLIVPDAVLAVEKITDGRLGRYLHDTAQRRAEAWKQIESAPDKMREIEKLEKDYEQQHPAGLPLLQNPWLFAGGLLFVATVEAVLTVPALSAIREYAGGAQWFIAIMVGLLLVAIVLFTGRAIAYVIKLPRHRDDDQYRFVRWVMLGLATLGLLFILSIPVFLTYSREYNEGVIRAAEQEVQQPEGDNPVEELVPSLFWTLLLQEAGLIAGLIASTLWALGDDYRRYQKEVAGGFARLERDVAEARKELETLAREDEATLMRELADADHRHYEFCRCRQVSAARRRSDMARLGGRIPPPDHTGRIKLFRSMTETIEQIRRQIIERLGQKPPERWAIEPGEDAEAEGQDTASAGGSGPKAHVPPPDDSPPPGRAP